MAMRYKSLMVIFLDESGDLGFNLDSRSYSRFFVITLLVCKNSITAGAFKAAVKKTLRRKLNHKGHRKRIVGELKSTGVNLQIKQYFLRQVLIAANQDWSLYSIVLDKGLLASSDIKYLDKNRIYNVMSHRILEALNLEAVKTDINLVVDKCKGRRERRIFDNFLRVSLESRLPLGTRLIIRHENSECVAGLQAVDLFCSGFLRKYLLADVAWYELFAHKVSVELLFRA